MWFNGELCANPEEQMRGTLFNGLGRRCCKQSPWRELEVQSKNDLSLTELWQSPIDWALLGKDTSFLPPAEVVI